jgi:FixJ family two-component response regulator
MHEDDDSLFAAVRAGARGYLQKGAEQEDIARAVRGMAAGEAVFGPGVAQRVLGQLTASSATSAAANPFPQLTARELDVLDLLAAGVPSADIASRLGLASKTSATMSRACWQSCTCPTARRRQSWHGRPGLGQERADEYSPWLSHPRESARVRKP